MKRAFWQGKRVLVTGHTGFKGAWTCALLEELGAEVSALALAPGTEPNLWALIGSRLQVRSRFTDLRDRSSTEALCRAVRPRAVIHLAAQTLVRRSYADPVETYSTNLMGMVNLLESLRGIEGIDAVLVVTSDKVYANAGDGLPFAENGTLGGSDPYSASKAATEIVARSYAESFFEPRGVTLATARGGNVIGGGDFAIDRLVPDVYRAARAGRAVELRYPHARRPWQHVLDCVSGYLAYVEFLHGKRVADPPSLNFGPAEEAEMTVSELADLMGRRLGNVTAWVQRPGALPEKAILRLDSRLARKILDWRPRLDLERTMEWTAEWYARFAGGEDALGLVRSQIGRYLGPDV